MKKILKIPNISPFPDKFKPMLPTLIKQPFDSPEFIFEIKWDGFRALTFIDNGLINIFSRRGYSFNKRFPGILNCFKDFTTSMILDGEIVVADEEGKADFESLRYYTPGSGKRLCYYVFDILFYEKTSLLNTPLIERKRFLKTVIPKGSFLMYVDFIENNGIEFFALAENTGIEGIVAKRKSSVYVPGIRTSEWLKVKTNSHREYIEKNPREF